MKDILELTLGLWAGVIISVVVLATGGWLWIRYDGWQYRRRLRRQVKIEFGRLRRRLRKN